MDPTESLRAYAVDTNQNLQTDSYNNSLIASDSYNFLTGTGVLEGSHKDQTSQLQGSEISDQGPAAAAQDPSGPGLIGTLFTNQPPASSGSFPRRESSVPKSNSWENINGAGLYNNSNMQNILIGGSGMMAAPTSAATAQLLIGGLQGGSFNDGSHSDHGSVYYASANNHQESMAQMYYVNAAAGYSNAGFHPDGQSGVTTLLYPSQDEGNNAPPQSTCDQSQPPFGVPFLPPALALSGPGGIPLSLHEHAASRSASQSYNWRNEHSFLPMNEESLNHQSQFDTDHLPPFGVSRACHDLSHMQQTEHLQNEVGLHMERLKGISVNGQGLSLSLSSHQTPFHSAGGSLGEADHMAAVGQAAAIAKTKELASRYLSGASADLSRFRTQTRDDAVMGQRYLQEHMDNGGRKHLASSSHSGPSAGSSNHISASRFLGSAQAILNEVCRVTSLKRHPRPAKSSDHHQQQQQQQQQHWNMAGGSSTSFDGSFTNYNGKDDRSAILSEVDSVRDPASGLLQTSPLVTVSHIPLESEMIQGLADAARTQNRDDLEMKKQKLSSMLDEVEARYRRYCDQLQQVITAFNSQAGPNTATPYTILALQAMSRHFRCLRDAIGNQLKMVKRALGEDDRSSGLGETSRLRYVDQQIRQQRALQQLGMLQQHAWRPQRGLPERAVSVLRAWLFEHFLHPYPKDVDKMSLAKQTGLTRSQVSNWFINARVRLWKPMVEEMYVEEQKENEDRLAAERLARDQVELENNTYEQYEGDRGNSGLLHEVSANVVQAARIPIGMKRNDDREHDNSPSLTEAVGTIVTESHPQPLPMGHHLDIDVAGNYNQEGREAKKARNSASDAFHPNSNMMHAAMDVDDDNCEHETLNFATEDEDLQGDGDTGFGTQSQVLNRVNIQDNNGYTVSQDGPTTVDQIQPTVGVGAFGVYDGHNIVHRYGNEEITGYGSRTVSAGPTLNSGVSLTLGLRHCDANQLRPAMISPILTKSYSMDMNDPMNQLNRVDLYEGRLGDVSNNGQSSTAMNNGHYLQIAQDIPNNSNQQLSPHREFIAN